MARGRPRKNPVENAGFAAEKQIPSLIRNQPYQEIMYSSKPGKVKYVQNGNQFAADGSFVGREH